MQSGIFKNISNADYHSDKTIYSSSIIKLMDTPAIAKYWIDNPSPYKDCWRMGSAIHKYILERDQFNDEFLTTIDIRRSGKSNKAEWSAWFTEHGAIDSEAIISEPASKWNSIFKEQSGNNIVTPDEMEKIKQISEAVFANRSARNLLEKGTPEVSVYWKDEETGLHLKCRPDYLSICCSDLKTIKSIDDHTINNQIHKLGYPLSAAMYSDGIHQRTNELKPFTFIFVNKTAPYICRVFVLDDIGAEMGWNNYRRNLLILAECVDKNEWTGYSQDIETAITPKWAIYED